MIEVQRSRPPISAWIGFSGCCWLPKATVTGKPLALGSKVPRSHFLVCLSSGLMSIWFLLSAKKSNTQSLRCRRSVRSSLRVSLFYYLHVWQLTGGELWTKAFLVSECHFERHMGAEGCFSSISSCQLLIPFRWRWKDSLVCNSIIWKDLFFFFFPCICSPYKCWLLAYYLAGTHYSKHLGITKDKTPTLQQLIFSGVVR